MAEKKVYCATGRRKGSAAQVRMTSGKGIITINGVDVHEYLPYETLVMDLMQPLELTNTVDKFDITVSVKGGGFSGQTGAIRLGIARALCDYEGAADARKDGSFRKTLKANGMITRDARTKERKKYGLKKARRAPQFSKR